MLAKEKLTKAARSGNGRVHVRTGDTVVVLSGKDRGKQGKDLRERILRRRRSI